MKRLVRAGAAKGRRRGEEEGEEVMRRLSHRRPIVVSGQRVAGASFLGWEASPVKRPRKGHVGSWGSCGEVAAAGAPPPVSKPASPQPVMKAAFWSGLQISQLGQYCRACREPSGSLFHTGSPELTGLG